MQSLSTALALVLALICTRISAASRLEEDDKLAHWNRHQAHAMNEATEAHRLETRSGFAAGSSGNGGSERNHPYGRPLDKGKKTPPRTRRKGPAGMMGHHLRASNPNRPKGGRGPSKRPSASSLPSPQPSPRPQTPLPSLPPERFPFLMTPESPLQPTQTHRSINLPLLPHQQPSSFRLPTSRPNQQYSPTLPTAHVPSGTTGRPPLASASLRSPSPEPLSPAALDFLKYTIGGSPQRSRSPPPVPWSPGPSTPLSPAALDFLHSVIPGSGRGSRSPSPPGSGSLASAYRQFH